MNFKRFISTAQVKNTYQYINTQKKYEIIRTIVYFAVSISLFIAGYIATESKLNLLTVVAVLGCLPASKSMVSMIMFCRFKSCDSAIYDKVCVFDRDLECLYDLVFTTEKKTYVVAHGAYKSKCLVLFSQNTDIDTGSLENHIHEYLKRASISGVTVKVYSDIEKYKARLEALMELEREEDKTAPEVIRLLKEITL